MFSVIIPVYNRYEMVKEAVRSVLRQTFHEFELLLVDDGSDDRLKFLGNSCERGSMNDFPIDSRLKILRIPHTGMPGAVRNAGAAEAGEEYLAFLDSDDLWYPEKLASQAAYLDGHPLCSILHSRERWLRNGEEVSQKRLRHKREGDIFADALKKCIIGPSTTVVRRDVFNAIGGFREDLEVAEDYELWLRWTACYPVGHIDIPLGDKRAGNWDQLSFRYGQIEKFRISGLLDLVENRWFELHAGREKQRQAERELAGKCAVYASGARKRNRLLEAGKYESIRIRYEGS